MNFDIGTTSNLNLNLASSKASTPTSTLPRKNLPWPHTNVVVTFVDRTSSERCVVALIRVKLDAPKPLRLMACSKPAEASKRLHADLRTPLEVGLFVHIFAAGEDTLDALDLAQCCIEPCAAICDSTALWATSEHCASLSPHCDSTRLELASMLRLARLDRRIR